MSKESRGKDAAMAANLKKSSTHSHGGVAGYKNSRLNALMASLSPGLVGSAAYRRARGGKR